MKKFITALTALVMSVSACCAVTASAAQAPGGGSGTAQPMYDYARYPSCSLTISDKTATCISSCDGVSGVTKINATQYLEYKVSGKWETYADWYRVSFSNSFSMTTIKQNLPSNTYRVRTVFNVYYGNKTETVEKISSTVTI